MNKLEKWKKQKTQSKKNKQPLDTTIKKFIRIEARKKQNKGYYYQKKAPKQMVKAKREGEIILGFKDPETQEQLVKITKEQRKAQIDKKKELLRNKVSVENLGKGPSIVISGGKRGAGKSILASLIGIDQLAQEDKNHFMAVDPQAELRHHLKPNLKDEELFESFDLEPFGHQQEEMNNNPELKFYTPYFLEDHYPEEKQGKLTQLNSDNLHYKDLEKLIETYLPKTGKQKLLDRFQDRLYQYLKKERGYDLEKTAITGETPPKIEELTKHIARGKSEEKRRKNQVLRTLRKIISLGILGEKTPYHDPINEMENGDIPVFQTSTSDEWKTAISTYLSPILNEIYRDKARRDKGKPHRLEKDQFILQAEEADVLYPQGRKLPAKKQISRYLKAGRQLGTGMVLTAPSFNSIASEDDYTLIKQSFIITARITNDVERKIIQRKLGGINYNHPKIKKIQNLSYKTERLKKGMAPAEFALIDPGGRIETFYPIPSFSDFKREEP